jgi:hypothetical protein
MADTTRIEQAVEAFNRRDEAYYDLYTDDVTVHGLPGMGSVDKEGLRASTTSSGRRSPMRRSSRSTWSQATIRSRFGSS